MESDAHVDALLGAAADLQNLPRSHDSRLKDARQRSCRRGSGDGNCTSRSNLMKESCKSCTQRESKERTTSRLHHSFPEYIATAVGRSITGPTPRHSERIPPAAA